MKKNITTFVNKTKRPFLGLKCQLDEDNKDENNEPRKISQKVFKEIKI